jgi:hypothetical protein
MGFAALTHRHTTRYAIRDRAGDWTSCGIAYMQARDGETRL